MGGAPKDTTGSRTITESSYCPIELRKGAEPWRFQDFKVQKILGEGAMSTVVQCSCLKTEVLVAIKMYHKERMNSLNIKQVAREIEIHSSVLHPNIIKLYAAFEDADGIYLVQELAPKGDLYLELSRHGGYMLEAHVVKNVMQPFLSALAYLHSLGILHRDVKPENVLLAADGEIKLADFGLAINTTKEKPMSRVGTLDYMPPEIAALPRAGSPIPLGPLPPPHPDGGNYGLPADVWCAGVLAYELLVGGPPFEADTKEATYIRIIKVDPVLPVHLSENAKDYLRKTLIKDPTKRPTVGQLLRHPWLKNVQRPRSMVSLANSSSTSTTSHAAMHNSTTTKSTGSSSPIVEAYALSPNDQDSVIASTAAAVSAGSRGNNNNTPPDSPTGSNRGMSFGSLLTGRFTPKPSKPLSLSDLKSSSSPNGSFNNNHAVPLSPTAGGQQSKVTKNPVSNSNNTQSMGQTAGGSFFVPGSPLNSIGGPFEPGSPQIGALNSKFDHIDLNNDVNAIQHNNINQIPDDPDDGNDIESGLIPASFPPSLLQVLGRPESNGNSVNLSQLESPRRTGMLGMYLKKLSLGALAASRGAGNREQQQEQQPDTAGWNKAASSSLPRKSRLAPGSPSPIAGQV